MDLPYARVIGTLGIAAGDQEDANDLPEIIPCTEGEVHFIPQLKEVRYLPDGGNMGFLLGGGTIVCTLNSMGQLVYEGRTYVNLVDLGHSTITPRVEAPNATYRVEFKSIRARGELVKFSTYHIRPIAGQENDLASLVPFKPGPVAATTAGAPGKSAYQLWLEAGNVGTVDDFLGTNVNFLDDFLQEVDNPEDTP